MESLPLDVVLSDYSDRRIENCISYTSTADGRLTINLADGSTIDFPVEAWADVHWVVDDA